MLWCVIQIGFRNVRVCCSVSFKLGHSNWVYVECCIHMGEGGVPFKMLECGGGGG